jgi:hypothetical protein
MPPARYGNLPGRLHLIECRGAAAGLTVAERQALASANVIVYERALDALVGALLPLGGYAEPAPQAETTRDRPIFERCLKFAFDGWKVVQLMQQRPSSERASWLQDAAEQLARAGVSLDTPVQVLVDTPDGVPVNIETELRSASAAIADRDEPNGVMLVLGAIAAGLPPHTDAFAANGLAG